MFFELTIILTIYFDLVSILHSNLVTFQLILLLTHIFINNTDCIKRMDWFYFCFYPFSSVVVFVYVCVTLIRSACLMFNEIKMGGLVYAVAYLLYAFSHDDARQRKPISHEKTKAINFDHFSKTKQNPDKTEKKNRSKNSTLCICT